MRVKKERQPIQFHQRILQRRRRQQQLLFPGKGDAQCLADFIAILVGIAQLVRLIQHDTIPIRRLQWRGILARKFIRHNQHAILKRRQTALGNPAGQGEFLAQFLLPLLAQSRRTHHQQTPSALRPQLTQRQTSLNRFAQPDLIGEYHSLMQWMPKRK